MLNMFFLHFSDLIFIDDVNQGELTIFVDQYRDNGAVRATESNLRPKWNKQEAIEAIVEWGYCFFSIVNTDLAIYASSVDWRRRLLCQEKGDIHPCLRPSKSFV